MKILRLFLLISVFFVVMNTAAADTRWINNITITEYNIKWDYTETFTGMDSLLYRIALDSKIGDNDSFINVWEIMKADKESRKIFRNSIENEPDVRINNETSMIEIADVDSFLSLDMIGKTHTSEIIENRFNVTYRLKDSIYNASSAWFLGEPKSPVTIIIPEGIDIVNVTGMDNVTRNMDLRGVTGYFSNGSNKRGEITINISRNASYPVNYPANNISVSNITEEKVNITGKDENISSSIREWSIIGIGIIFIVLIYVFKVRRY